MGIVYSMYDVLVSINVPDEKAKAVIDAMEREMMDKLATKADVENLRLASQADLAHAKEIISRDIKDVALGISHVRDSLSKDIQASATRVDLVELGRSLTTRLYMTAASTVALNCTIMFGILKFLR